MKILVCLDCGQPKSRKGSYCKKCGYKYRTRPKGLKYKLLSPNLTKFKKGMIPWNKGLKGVIKPNAGSFKKGQHSSPETEFKKGHIAIIPKESRLRGSKHPNWKGEAISYSGIHNWIKSQLGKADKCESENCDGTSKIFQWSNISGLYKRDLLDWQKLCIKCHHKFDQIAKRSWITRRVQNA